MTNPSLSTIAIYQEPPSSDPRLVRGYTFIFTLENATLETFHKAREYFDESTRDNPNVKWLTTVTEHSGLFFIHSTTHVEFLEEVHRLLSGCKHVVSAFNHRLISTNFVV